MFKHSVYQYKKSSKGTPMNVQHWAEGEPNEHHDKVALIKSGDTRLYGTASGDNYYYWICEYEWGQYDNMYICL